MVLFAFAALATASALGQTYWVDSATVTHAGGWPSVNVDTRTPPFMSNGYVWQASGQGGQLNPGGLQVDGTHNKVDGYYALYSDATYYGSGSLTNGDLYMQRENITITFKIRCSYTSTPPTPGTPEFSIRLESNADVNPISSPAYNHAVANAYYIPPLSSSVSDWKAEAEKPGGAEGDEPGHTAHRDETGSAPSGWTSVGTNLWETTVTVPVPVAADDPDEDLDAMVEGTSASFGSFATARSHAHCQYEFRCISLGAVSLQASY